ncbi:MAG: hypothetical protein AAFX02_11550 [Pseudomonadota bacterium]
MSTEWTEKDEIDAAERRLKSFCDQVNAGNAQGGAREFYRQIDAAFRNIRKEAQMPVFKMNCDS